MEQHKTRNNALILLRGALELAFWSSILTTEPLALHWQDIDFYKRYARVEKPSPKSNLMRRRKPHVHVMYHLLMKSDQDTLEIGKIDSTTEGEKTQDLAPI